MLQLPSNAADPLIESLAYQKLIYADIVRFLINPATTPEQRAKVLCFYPFPCFIITITGVDVQVHGASITGTYTGCTPESISVSSQHLSPKVTFTWPRHSTAQVVELARMLYGLHEGGAVAAELYSARSSIARILTLPRYPLPSHALELLEGVPESVAEGKLLWRGRRRSGEACSGGGETSGGGGGAAALLGGGGVETSGSGAAAPQSGGGGETSSGGGDGRCVILKYTEQYGFQARVTGALRYQS